MKGDLGFSSSATSAPAPTGFQRFRSGPLAPFIAEDALYLAGHSDPILPDSSASIVAAHLLQDIPDYRAALRSWFAGVRIGGHLVVIVPHAFLTERQLALPVRERPAQRRLYTPRSLLDEAEEALSPNSYRIRLLCDDDQGYDYDRQTAEPRTGNGDILLAIEKIVVPDWSPALPEPQADLKPDYAFEPPRTRIEVAQTRPRHRILILKLDHLGDFIIGTPALQRARALFADAHITLVVGSWNRELAETLGVADEVRTFDAFPRNSSEEEVDVPGKRALIEKSLPDHYDLAIDLRTDGDTRTLLGRVKASLKAGLGTRADFPFLDIAFPIDLDRTHRESAREFRLDHHAFHSQDSVSRLPHRSVFAADRLTRNGAIIWGPYWHLRPGRYLFDPFLEFDAKSEGLLMLDVAMGARRVARRFVTPGAPLRIEFDVESANDAFEFRIWAAEETPAIDFSFYGGRLVRQGVPGELHQSDYLELLVDLVARRLDRVGLLTELPPS